MFKILTTVLEIYDMVTEQAKTKYKEADLSNISPISMLVLSFSLLFLLIKKAINSEISDQDGLSDGNITVSQGDTVVGGVAEAVLGKPEVKVTSKFGADRSWNRTKAQIAQGKTKHMGVDLQAKTGDLVYAPFDGIIINAKNSNAGSGGRTVVIKSDEGNNVVMVCHLSRVNVTKNQHVSKGDVLGRVGGSGYGSDSHYSPHLHLQLGSYKGNIIEWRNPAPLLRAASFKCNIKGADVVEIMKFFITKLNISPSQAAGICGNLMAESGFIPSAYNGSRGGMGAMGIASWRAGRITKYIGIYGKTQREDANLAHQLEYVCYELTSVNPYTKALSLLKKCVTPEQSADVILGYYEFNAGVQSAVSRLGTGTRIDRQQYARGFYNLYLSKYGESSNAKPNHTVNKSTQNIINNFNKHTWH